MKFHWIGIVVLCAVSAVGVQSQDNAAKIDSLIRQMSLEEKAQLVVGVGRRTGGTQTTSAPVIGSSALKVPGAAGTTASIPRLGIPNMVLADGPAGLRISPRRGNEDPKTYYATGFPVATLVASTWDVDLAQKLGAACGEEVREYGVDIWLAPGLNIHRNPLGGRNFEYYSEDPLITGRMAAAVVNGMQAMGVGTSIKHYAANNQETSRNTIDTIVSERALREIYLKGFEIAVKLSNPWTVMSSYNKINGIYTSESADLLTAILRNDWRYKGFVMTDWGGGRDPVAQMNAGNDLLMPGRPEQSQKIIEAVQSGALDIKILDRNVAKILNILLQSPAYKNYKYSDKPDLAAHAQTARVAATEGMVLLKNENGALPLKNVKKIALFGNASYDLIAGGTGSGDVNKAYVVSLAQGLAPGYELDAALKDAYESYLKQEKAKAPAGKGGFMAARMVAPMPVEAGLIAKNAEQNDVAVLTLSRNAGEGADRKLEGDFYLTAQEKEMMHSVAGAFHARGKKAVVVLNIGGVIETASWRDGVDAILLAWQPGQEGGYAIADVLSGKVNPSGKLATTFPVDYKDVPSAKSFPGTPNDKPQQVVYEDGIYVGYRYYSTFHVKPSYEFGYGLSYTRFDYGKIKLSSPAFKEPLTVSVTVTNNGPVAGREVVELYISAPAQKMDKPESELRAFAKTKLLAPGRSETLNFSIKAADLASFDSKDSCWIAEAGTYTVKIGASSLDIRQSATFRLPADTVVEKLSKALAPQVPITELKKN